MERITEDLLALSKILPDGVERGVYIITLDTIRSYLEAIDLHPPNIKLSLLATCLVCLKVYREFPQRGMVSYYITRIRAEIVLMMTNIITSNEDYSQYISLLNIEYLFETKLKKSTVNCQMLGAESLYQISVWIEEHLKTHTDKYLKAVSALCTVTFCMGGLFVPKDDNQRKTLHESLLKAQNTLVNDLGIYNGLKQHVEKLLEELFRYYNEVVIKK